MINLMNRNYLNIEDYQNKYNNSEIVAKIDIEGTNINKLVTQTNDNDHYLTYSLDNKKNDKGNIFIDYRNNILNSKKIIIYGHNSKKYDADFKELENYMDYNYYINHKFITLKTKYYDKEYEIFSVALYNNNYSYLQINFDNQNWYDHLLYLQNNSIYKIDVELKNNDSIIVLQTCSQKYKDTFLVISAKLV